MTATIHRVRNARRRLAGHLPSRHPDRKPLKLSRWRTIEIVDEAGRALGKSFRQGYLHPTKGLRFNTMPILSRWPTAE